MSSIPKVEEWDCWNPTYPVGALVMYRDYPHKVIDAGPEQGRRLAGLHADALEDLQQKLASAEQRLGVAREALEYLEKPYTSPEISSVWKMHQEFLRRSEIAKEALATISHPNQGAEGQEEG